MKITENLQKILPFGYLFLVVLGILKESIFYFQIGVNILKYSTLMDVLISPIADLTSHPIILIAVVLLVLILFGIMSVLSRKHKKEWVKKLINSKTIANDLTDTEIQSHFGKIFIAAFCIGSLSFFLGIGLGTGRKVSDKIAKNNLSYNCKMTYNTGEIKTIYLIGSNSINYFYAEKGNKNIKISPVGSIKTLELLNEETNEK
jgi:hypothetical protein